MRWGSVSHLSGCREPPAVCMSQRLVQAMQTNELIKLKVEILKGLVFDYCASVIVGMATIQITVPCGDAFVVRSIVEAGSSEYPIPTVVPNVFIESSSDNPPGVCFRLASSIPPPWPFLSLEFTRICEEKYLLIMCRANLAAGAKQVMISPTVISTMLRRYLSREINQETLDYSLCCHCWNTSHSQVLRTKRSYPKAE
jgi:hypothetical protein